MFIDPGTPEDKIPKIVQFAPDQKLVKDGDTYAYITASPEGPKERKFQSGVEFDDVIGVEKTPVSILYNCIFIVYIVDSSPTITVSLYHTTMRIFFYGQLRNR